MKLQVLVSTMHQYDHKLLEKMNIQSDAIIINQCDRNEFEEFSYKDHNIRVLSMAERGVGLSRNTALMRAEADICLFADDDVEYMDGYRECVIKVFKDNPKIDVVVFNIESTNPDRKEYMNINKKRIRFYNCLRYGTFRIAVRTSSIRKANINFSLLFGGGAKYGSGEDSLFIMECIKKGLCVYAYPDKIGNVTHSESTWFNGYTEKFFIDKGALFASISKIWAELLCLQFVLRRREMFKQEVKGIEAFKLMMKGIREIKN